MSKRNTSRIRAALYVPAGGGPIRLDRAFPIDDLSRLQAACGGYVQVVLVPPASARVLEAAYGISLGPTPVMWVNENGLLHGLPYNEVACAIVMFTERIVGDALVVDLPPDEPMPEAEPEAEPELGPLPEAEPGLEPRGFPQISTGQTLPNGLLIRQGTCSQCGRVGAVVRARLHVPGHRDTLRLPCAECVADIAAGCDALGQGGELWVEHEDSTPAQTLTVRIVYVPPAKP